jgi:hypothetical protein
MGKASKGFELTAWQKKQAAMLYHFTSVEYLENLHQMVSDLINGVIDPLLATAKAQNRDKLLINPVWGKRDTSQNWANNAWPFLKDLQASLADSIALRTANRFRITAVNECLRGAAESSLAWTTPGEEEAIEEALSIISTYAGQYDRTVKEYENRWNDYRFAYNYPAFAAGHRRIPRFAVRDDIRGESGKIPPRTGVYICPDDQYATLQFVWAEHGGAQLRVANTFNQIGLAALASVGRKDLWFDEQKMFDFAMSNPYAAQFQASVFLDGAPYPSLAPAAVARSAFTTRPCTWQFVEMLAGEFEELDALVDPDASTESMAKRIVGGERCEEAGFYFTPSAPNSRRFFKAGEIVPKVDSSYGVTYWQWDSNQT